MNNNLSTGHFILIFIAIILIGWILVTLFKKPTTIYNVPLAPVAPPLSQTIESMNSISTSQNPALSSESNRPENLYILYNFYSPKCPHCRNFSPVWKDVTDKLNSNKRLTTRGVDVTIPENEHIVFYYNVSSLPTIILATPDRNIEYTGDRSTNDLINFVSKHT